MYDQLVSSLALSDPTGDAKLIPSFFHTMTCPHQKAPSSPLANPTAARVALVALVVPYVAAAFYFATKAAGKK